MAIQQRHMWQWVERVVDSVVRGGLVLGFSAVETTALVVWLAFVTDVGVLSRTFAAGVAVLLAGLFVRNFLMDLAVREVAYSYLTMNAITYSYPAREMGPLILAEAVLWGGWLLAANSLGGFVGLAAGGVLLAVLAIPVHTIAANVYERRPAVSTVASLDAVWYSVVQAAGATGWLYLLRQPDLTSPALESVGIEVVDPVVLAVLTLGTALALEHWLALRSTRQE